MTLVRDKVYPLERCTKMYGDMIRVPAARNVTIKISIIFSTLQAPKTGHSF